MKIKWLIAIVYAAYCLNILPGYVGGDDNSNSAEAAERTYTPGIASAQINTTPVANSINYVFTEINYPDGG